MAVGIGRTAALLTVAVAVILVAATQVATAACRAVVAAAPIAGEAELQCVRRCTTEMLACAAASGCASSSATVSLRRRDGGSGALAPCGGVGCESEYLGCIDVC